MTGTVRDAFGDETKTIGEQTVYHDDETIFYDLLPPVPALSICSGARNWIQAFLGEEILAPNQWTTQIIFPLTELCETRPFTSC